MHYAHYGLPDSDYNRVRGNNMNIANKYNYALSVNDIDTPALCSAPDNVPHGFSWVRWTPMFRYAWDEITKGGHEIVTVLGQGGSGKSVLLEMV